ncbi:insulinase family protein [Thalassotalea crassostreae]|uniref:insulinase family protein n=1 Tax=Thalassotalea crassostreae TaxID=1763536 RepID=UPI0009EE5508|nr:insulinase family protein [Thalassotalea crassostreae]
MKQSPNDLKVYQPLTLNNGLRVLLVENQESNRSAASLAVNAGHFDDPKDRQGLAHFLEHMLFLGTKKYPESGEYQQFLSKHSGSNNAWTGTEHTCFFFDINREHFETALDRFSQFFIAPLLSQEFIEKERQNIDAEFKMKLKDDMRRIYDVHKESVNPDHPFSKFSVGSIDTLADRDDACLKDEVENFFDKFYRAELMTLVLEGPQSIEELTALATSKFSEIKSLTQPKQKISEPLYLSDNLAKRIHIKPEKNDRKLIISFPMPGIDETYPYKPISYLGYLLGHEGTGSVLAYLKNKQWALSLTAGGGINGSNFKDFNISIRLTEDGEHHIEDIVSLVFAYIGMIKKAGVNETYFEEKKAISEFSFQYQEKLKPIDSVNQLVINMQHYPEQDYMFGDYVMESLNEDLIHQFLNYLNADNIRLVCINQNLETDKVSHWYKVPYKIEPISEELIKHWHSDITYDELSLPEANPYIVAKPTLVPPKKEKTTPKLIKQKPGLKIWFKQDSSFFVPKGQIFIGIDSTVSVQSKANIAMTRLFVELFSDSVLEQNYHAELAGIHYHLYPHQGGMTLQLSGINEKQPLLLESLLQSIKDHSLAPERFSLFKKQLITTWTNAEKSKSISQLFAKLSALMKPFSPSGKDLANALQDVSYEMFSEFCNAYFDKLCIEVFIYGNWLEPQADSIADLIDTQMSGHLDENAGVTCEVVDYQNQGSSLLPQILEEHDYASVIYFPMAKNDEKTMALTMITSHLMSPLFFQDMRTERQFGYLVGVGYVPMNRFPGIAFYIQSPQTSADTLFAAMEQFIEDFDSSIGAEQWQHLQQGLIGQLQEKDTSPRVKSQRYWMNICNKDYGFNQKEKLIAAVQSVTLADIDDFIKQNLANSNTPDKICLASVKHGDELSYLSENHTIINDIDRFHQELPHKS